MEQKSIRILIADDNLDMCDYLCNHFSSVADIMVTGVAHDGTNAYRLFQEGKPDVVLLDLVMPYMDGFSFLEQAAEDKLLNQSKIIVVSGIHEDRFVNRALSLGADYYIMKPFDVGFLEKRIRKQCTHNATYFPQQAMVKEETETRPIKQRDTNLVVARLLIDSGVPVHTLGYKYFQCAIKYLLEQDTDVFSITKTIYPYIAIKYETSSSCVDKAMRHSLNLAIQDKPEMLCQFLQEMNYRNCNAKPSNSEFLNLILERIKQDDVGLHS